VPHEGYSLALGLGPPPASLGPERCQALGVQLSVKGLQILFGCDDV
jgi:hypothetical protein